MSEQRLIDANNLGVGKANPDVFERKDYAYGWNSALQAVTNAASTIAPETLPIVQELRKEINRMKEAVKTQNETSKYWCSKTNELAKEVCETKELLEKVTAERDEAVEQLRGDCEKCSHYKVTWNGCTPDFECPLSDRCLNRDMWEWKGFEEVKNDG